MGWSLTWLTVLVAVVCLFAGYLSYTAGRLDRLHHRVESTRAGLAVQLARRAGAAVEAAHLLDPETGGPLARAGVTAVAAADAQASVVVLEQVENDLTRALHVAFADPAQVGALRADPVADHILDVLAQACVRVQLARRFHNDAVAQAQRVRRKLVVRWARLAGHAGWPQMLELDDTPPPALVRSPV